MFIARNAQSSLAPLGASCKIADHIPLLTELADAYSLTRYKHFAPDGVVNISLLAELIDSYSLHRTHVLLVLVILFKITLKVALRNGGLNILW